MPCDVVVGRVEDVAIAEEAAGEATKDQDSISVLLKDAAALTFWQDLVVDADHLPGGARLVVVALDGVDVFAALVGNTAEHIDPAVTHRARCVIVPTNIEVRHLEPEIDTGVVHLALHVRVILLLARTGNNNKLVAEPSDGVAVPRVLHHITLHELRTTDLP